MKKFEFIFKRGYICCVCKMRYASGDSEFVYKKSCICRSCFRKMEHTSPKSAFEGTKNVNFVSSPFYYDGIYRNIFLSFKFNGNYAYGHLLGMAAGRYFENYDELKLCDAVVPVPLSKRRMSERGYNQSEIMAEYTAAALGLPCENLLERKRNTMVQSRLSGIERVKNVRGAFVATGDVEGKRIILMDDIFTTGSTMEECAITLKNSGAESVYGITAAYVPRKTKSEPSILV